MTSYQDTIELFVHVIINKNDSSRFDGDAKDRWTASMRENMREIIQQMTKSDVRGIIKYDCVFMLEELCAYDDMFITLIREAVVGREYLIEKLTPSLREQVTRLQ